jgi:predicted site-specific integrase-resolvase
MNGLKDFQINIIVVNDETLSLNEELVQDIIFILHVLSYKIYGMIKYKKKIVEDE